MTTDSTVVWEIQHSIGEWDCCRILILLETSKTQNRPRENPVYLQESNSRSHKLDVQEANFHISTESEVVSLDAGLRMDGIPALDLWDLVVEVLHSSVHQPRTRCNLLRDKHCEKHSNARTKKQSNTSVDLGWTHVDYVTSNAKLSRFGALLYFFEDNEAVIKMMINGRSPTMRHVTRTHRVALDRLFDRMNLDRKIQIKYVNTKSQLDDILTKGSFARDEWKHFLCQCNCSHLRTQIKDPHPVSKRQMQQRKQGGEDERVVAKSKPARNLVSKTLNRSTTALSSSSSQSPGNTQQRVQFGIHSVRGSP